jgi:hypothetical protein
LGADELGYVTVAEAQRDDRALRGDATEAVGQVPEQHEKAQLEVLEAVDGHVKRQRVRALHAAAEDAVDQRRPASAKGDELLIQ